MLYYEKRFPLIDAIRHELGHIIVAVLARIRIRSSIAHQDGRGTTDFVTPFECYANQRLSLIWDYITAGPQNVSARWMALRKAFAAERPATSAEEIFAYRGIAILMAGTIAEGEEFPYRPGSPAVDVDDASKVWSLMTLLDLPVSDLFDLDAYVSAHPTCVAP